MACACKGGGSAKRQVARVKQVVKRPPKTIVSNTKPVKKISSRRIIVKHI